MTTTMHTIEHIVSTPGICGGRPRIAGHRIRVQDIVLAYEGAGGHWSVERIAEEYEISPGQIHAALSYYYDHRDEIEREMRKDEAAAKKLIGEMGVPSVKEWVDKRQARREDKP